MYSNTRFISSRYIHYRVINNLARLLDNRFQIFGFRFGLDPLIGLIPGIGDIIAFSLSAYVLFAAVHMGIPRDAIVRMIGNIIFDFMLGLIPFVGDAADFVYRANSKNVRILKEYMDNTPISGEIID